MSWLLVALIPGLLMVATVGLQRVESALGRDTVSAADVAEILEQARSQGVDSRPGLDPDSAVLRFAPHASVRVTDFDEFVDDHQNLETSPNDQGRGLPSPRYVVPGPKTEFQQTRQADRV